SCFRSLKSNLYINYSVTSAGIRDAPVPVLYWSTGPVNTGHQ
ncbi:unnamed protein product, partial [Rotaria magnacalcarata]